MAIFHLSSWKWNIPIRNNTVVILIVSTEFWTAWEEIFYRWRVFFFHPPFPKAKWIISSRPSISPFSRSYICGYHNSAITGRINSKSSSLEPSWPVDVLRHDHLSIAAARAQRGLLELCGCHNSVTTGLIHPNSCSLSNQTSWPVHVQCYGHLLIRATLVCHMCNKFS